jgi:glutaredoxin 3
MKAQIYTTPGCPYCVKAKRLLEQSGIEYSETVLEFDTQEMDELTKRTGYETVPQIFFGSEFIGGSDDLQELISKGGLAVYK